MTKEFKTITDCAWGECNNLKTELFIDGTPVAVLYMDNDQFEILPRAYDVPDDLEDYYYQQKSGAYYAYEEPVVKVIGCDPYEWMFLLTNELVFVKDSNGNWNAKTRDDAGIPMQE